MMKSAKDNYYDENPDRCRRIRESLFDEELKNQLLRWALP